MHTPNPDADLLPPATLALARTLRDDLSRLLAQERTAAADFLAALADFDARRGWEPLGHPSLFVFLNRELGLSKGAAYLRFTAVRLVRRFPEVGEALRSGQLCMSAIGELARVMTPENREAVLPQFFGCSSREARLVAAALVPRESPPTREIVTRLPLVSRQRPLQRAGLEGLEPLPSVDSLQDAAILQAQPQGAGEHALDDGSEETEARGTASASSRDLAEASGRGATAGIVVAPAGGDDQALAADPAREAWPTTGARAVAHPPRTEVRAHELAMTRPAWVPRAPECEPLDADLRRLHLTVSRGLLEKLEAGRRGLSHVLPGATTEQVLEAALDLLLEKQAKASKLLRPARGPRRPARKARTARVPSPHGSSIEPHAEPGAEPQAATAAVPGTAPGAAHQTTTSRAASGDPLAEEGAGKAASGTGPDRPEGRRLKARDERTIPAAIEREVRARDGGRCQFPLDVGGICGSTTRVQLDHVVPVALGGKATVENLRLLCAPHNLYAARLALGEVVMATVRRRRGRKGGRRRPVRAARGD